MNPRLRNSNSAIRFATQQSLNQYVWGICDILRRSNCAGALQYVPELTWILFLRILDERETRAGEEAEAVNAEFTPSLETPYRWQDWAAPPDVGQASSLPVGAASQPPVAREDKPTAGLEARSTGRHGCLPNVGWKRAELQNGALGAFFCFVNGELIPHLKRLREQPSAVPVSEI